MYLCGRIGGWHLCALFGYYIENMNEERSHNNEHDIAKTNSVDIEAVAAELAWMLAVYLSEQKVERSRTWLDPFVWLGEKVDLLTFLNMSEGDAWLSDDDVWQRLIDVWIEKVAEQHGYKAAPGSTWKDAEKYLCLKVETFQEILGKLNKNELYEFIKYCLDTEDGQKWLKSMEMKKNINRHKKNLDDNEWKMIDEFVEKHLNDTEVMQLLEKQREPFLRCLAFTTLTHDLCLGLSENYFFKRRPTPNIKALAKTLSSNLRKEIRELFKDYDPYYVEIE